MASSFSWQRFLTWAARTRRGSRPLQPDDIERWTRFCALDADSGPLDLLAYADALRAGGIPDLGNPWPQGEDEHYLIHPGGFICGEIDSALATASSEDNADAFLARRAAAFDRLALLLDWGCPFLSAKAYFSPAETAFACRQALALGSCEAAGGRFQDALAFAESIGLVSRAEAAGIAAERALSDPLARAALAEACSQYLPPPPVEAPPALALDRWRRGRETHDAS